MKKNIFILMLLAPMMAMAQSMSQRGSSVETIVPEGWEHTEAVGEAMCITLTVHSWQSISATPRAISCCSRSMMN